MIDLLLAGCMLAFVLTLLKRSAIGPQKMGHQLAFALLLLSYALRAFALERDDPLFTLGTVLAYLCAALVLALAWQYWRWRWRLAVGQSDPADGTDGEE